MARGPSPTEGVRAVEAGPRAGPNVDRGSAAGTQPRRKPLRLPGFDYHAPGAFFVTICTFQRRPVLGTVCDDGVDPSEAGLMVARAWAALPSAYRGVLLDEFVVMPNHLHGLLLLNTEPPADVCEAEPVLALPDVVQRLKSWTTTRYRQSCQDYRAATVPCRI